MLLKAMDAGVVHLFSEGLTREEMDLTCAVPVRDLLEDVRTAMEREEGRRIAVIPEGPYVAPFLGQRDAVARSAQ
jgi:lactate racemase